MSEEFESEEIISNVQQSNIILEEEAFNRLVKVKKWIYFLSILSFFGIGVIIIASILLLTLGSVMFAEVPKPEFYQYFGIVYLVIGVVYYFPTKNLYNFGKGIQKLQLSKSSSDLTYSIVNISKMFTFVSIMTICTFALYFVFIIVFIVLMGEHFPINNIS